MSTRRAALYLRQSIYHDGSISEELQESTCRAMCEREGWTVVGVYKDIDVSGRSVSKRPGLKALRASFDAGDFDLAVAHAASRFARNMEDGAQIVGQMPIATVLEGEAPEDDDFMPLLHMLLAHKQSREIGKRWKEVHSHRVASGLPHSPGPRWGYAYDGKAYTPDPVTGPVLAECYRRYARGEGWLSIVGDLNTRGLRTHADVEWTGTVLRRVLDSGFGAGLLLVKGEHLPGAQEPVITEAEWQAYRAARKRRATKAPRSQTPGWHLALVAVCAECGGPLTTSGTTKPTAEGRINYRYAVCRRMANSNSCTGVRYRRDDIDHQVALWLGGHVSEWASALPDDTEARAQAEEALRAAQARLEATEALLGRLASGWASGVLDDAGYRLARQDADAEKLIAAEAVEDASQALADLLPADADVYERIAAGPDMSTGEWAETLRKVIKRIDVSRDGLRITPHIGEAAWIPRPKH